MYKKTAMFTDIHFGKKSNSEQHNQDCINFITWFCEQVKKDPEVDCIAFLGDWHENRSALNVSTLNYSLQGAQMLNDLGLPVYFLVGNHDLYHRHSRAVNSLQHLEELENFHLIRENTVVGDTLFVPFIFPDEYADLAQYMDVPVWMGHFEFKGFTITGYNIKMMSGPDPKDFLKPKRIFSGHFHRRQSSGNIVYIGNAFPMDFSDIDDYSRGMCTYNHESGDTEFTNWDVCPTYTKTKLSEVLDGIVDLRPNTTVICEVDIEIDFEENTYLRQAFIDKYKLRDLQLEEAPDPTIFADNTGDIDFENITNTNDLVVEMLSGIETDKLNNAMLVELFKDIPAPQ